MMEVRADVIDCLTELMGIEPELLELDLSQWLNEIDIWVVDETNRWLQRDMDRTYARLGTPSKTPADPANSQIANLGGMYA